MVLYAHTDSVGEDGNVTAAAALTAGMLIEGDGALGIAATAVTAAEVAANTAARHAAVTLNATATAAGMSIIAQDISHRAATNAQTGYATAAHITAIEANTAASHAALTLDASATAGGMSLAAQALSNRAATNALTGYATAAHITDIESNNTHRADNSQAHTDYLINTAADVGVGLSLTGDNASADTAYVPNILYNTDDTPPAAAGFPIGTLYVQYNV